MDMANSHQHSYKLNSKLLQDISFLPVSRTAKHFSTVSTYYLPSLIKIICIWPISANKQINSFCACTFRYLYIYYLPSGLFVVVSWVSFLIPPEVVPGRMALLVTLFLVLINIFNTITNVSPNVEGMTAISAWMIACMFFVFGALLAYASILYFLLVSSFDAMVPVGIWYYGTCMCLQVSDAC